MAEHVVETQETKNEETGKKAPLKQRIAEARPVKFVKRHAKGVAAGAVGAAAIATAAVLAARAAAQDGGLEDITDAIGDVVEEVIPE